MWTYNYTYPSELCHMGKKGMHWGVRRGPPYPIGVYKNKVEKISGNDKIKNREKHRGFYRQALKYTDGQANRAVRSFEKQIRQHRDKIIHPEKYSENWNKFSAKEKNWNIGHWETEIKKFKEQLEIVNSILKGR